ncbi:hypothetical protein Y1Q_0008904 [Alligator mississippiensis]|uniref:Uncharacterized protein n=1 Tax=Alligator mississippiensis TaxID=8496 RepID=A0A151NK64_ALLMI|nr:hypothetical protein Y1Q_0008904 [Alligator mississippiensis]
MRGARPPPYGIFDELILEEYTAIFRSKWGLPLGFSFKTLKSSLLLTAHKMVLPVTENFSLPIEKGFDISISLPNFFKTSIIILNPKIVIRTCSAPPSTSTLLLTALDPHTYGMTATQAAHKRTYVTQSV